MTIIEAIEDKALFGSLFKDSKTWTAWRVFLKVAFALPMNDEELGLYRAHTGRERPPLSPFKEVFSIVGRRGGKSFISAVIACYLALFHDWRPYLAPGEIAWIMVIASDRQQARVILNYIKGILQLSIFKGMVEKDLTWEIGLNNQVIIAIKTCDYRTLRGYTVVAAICDEIAFWRSEGANPAQEILTALRPALATIPGSLLLGISSPYSKTGPLYEAFREKYGQNDEDILIWKAPTKVMNPTIGDRVIEKALKEDYSAAKAEWLAEFREDLETYISTEALDAVIIPGRFELPRIEGASYFAFIDPSGGAGQDAMTLCISHKEGSGKIIESCVRIKRPPFNPKDCVKEFSEVLKSYGVSSVTGDKFSGDWCASSFREEGIDYKNSELSKSEIFLEFLPLIMQHNVELLDHRQTIIELRQLERRTGQGRDSVDHPRGLHDDCANVVAGAAILSISHKTCGWVFGVGRDEREDENAAPNVSLEEAFRRAIRRDKNLWR